MSLGPGGKYDRECELITASVGSDATVLIVLGGRRGSGFSMTINGQKVNPMGAMRAVADSMEHVAKQIRADLKRFEENPEAAMRASAGPERKS